MTPTQPIRAGILLGLLALAACNAYPPYRPSEPQPEGAAPVAAATADHARAAQQYESSAASQSGAPQVDTLLAAAREWLAAGRPADAARLLGRLGGLPVTAAQGSERGLIAAQVALDQQHPQD